jgi:hypothetical protein
VKKSEEKRREEKIREEKRRDIINGLVLAALRLNST